MKFIKLKKTQTLCNDKQVSLLADIGTNPSDTAVFTVWAQVSDASTSAFELSGIATIDYIAIFSEPKDLAQS